MEIYELSNKPALVKDAINYFWKSWGNDSNFKFYEDCILNSLNKWSPLPKFYIGIEQEQIVGTYALLNNDIISRQDLLPWFACLQVNESHRKRGYGHRLLNHGILQAKALGYRKLYLSTDLINYYEKNGWSQMGIGYGVFGDEFKIYEKATG